MIGIEVRVNGRLLCTAGCEGGDVWAEVHVQDRVANLPELPSRLRVSAIEDFVNLDWPGADALAPGDEITIRIVESAEVDDPVRNKREDADAEAAQERLTYEWLKRKYER
jgi:hypothetical protein